MDMNTAIQKYLYSLQNILFYQQDACDFSTPYQLEMNRQNAHNELVANHILPLLNIEKENGFSDTDVYVRTKLILSNLDKVWKIYDNTEFDLKDDTCLAFLSLYLEKLFASSECKNYLEGRTEHLRGITF